MFVKLIAALLLAVSLTVLPPMQPASRIDALLRAVRQTAIVLPTETATPLPIVLDVPTDTPLPTSTMWPITEPLPGPTSVAPSPIPGPFCPLDWGMPFTPTNLDELTYCQGFIQQTYGVLNCPPAGSPWEPYFQASCPLATPVPQPYP